MIRFFADIIYLFFFLTLTAPLYPLFDHWNKTGKAHKRSSIAQRMILRSFKICLAMAGTKLIVDGQENIPEDGAVLYVGNHSSYYDILCSYVATERGMGFFAKKEMEKIPCLSHWMRFINCLFLDRKNIKAGLATMNEGTKLLKAGFISPMTSLWGKLSTFLTNVIKMRRVFPLQSSQKVPEVRMKILMSSKKEVYVLL